MTERTHEQADHTRVTYTFETGQSDPELQMLDVAIQVFNRLDHGQRVRFLDFLHSRFSRSGGAS